VLGAAIQERHHHVTVRNERDRDIGSSCERSIPLRFRGWMDPSPVREA
jgi:hypothetical protein